MEIGEKWINRHTGGIPDAVAEITGFEGDHVLVRDVGGGAGLRVQRNTFLDHWHREFDLPTQERVRGILREKKVGVSPEVFGRPFNRLSILHITKPVGVGQGYAATQAGQGRDMWVIGIGDSRIVIDANQAAAVKEACVEQGIAFRDWGDSV
jgi:hypothetical protein